MTAYGKNAEGYQDPTASVALSKVSREEKAAKHMSQGMKKVFICSRYRADENHSTKDAVASARHACGMAISKGYAPYAPHLYLPSCLDDDDPAERKLGMAAGRAFLAVCDEAWQWGETVTEGMAEELELAKRLGIPIKVYNTIGIPYERWNGVKIKGGF